MSENNFKRLIESKYAPDQKRSEIKIDRTQILVEPFFRLLIWFFDHDKKFQKKFVIFWI